MKTSTRWAALIAVLTLLIMSPAPGQSRGLLGRQSLALGASFNTLHYSRVEFIGYDPPVYTFVDQSHSEDAMFAQLNLPAASGLDFNLGLSMQSGNSQTLWSPGIMVTVFLPDRDLKPFVTVSGGVVGTLDTFTADPIGYVGLTGGVELSLGENTFTTLFASFFRVNGDEEKGLGMELGHWFDPKVSGNVGFQYTDNGPDSTWIKDPHSLSLTVAFTVLLGDGKKAEPRPRREREPQPADVCPR